MALSAINLYTTWNMSHSGTKDTGLGIGFKHSPSKLLSTYNQLGANPPSGFAPYTTGTTALVDAWVSGSDIFFTCRSTNGIGRSVIRYTLNVSGDAITMSYTDNNTIGNILSGGNDWCGSWYTAQRSAIYDGSQYVYLCNFKNSGSANTPIIGKWDVSNMPFAAGNAEWLSPLQQNYGSWISGQVTHYPKIFLGANYLWVSSGHSGQIHAINLNDGSVAGVWVSYGNYSAIPQYSFEILGELSGMPCGSAKFPSGVTQNINKYDVSNLNSWSIDTKLLDASGDQSYVASYHHGRAHRDSNRYYAFRSALSLHELSLLGFGSHDIVWWQNGNTSSDRLGLIGYNDSTTTYFERTVFSDSSNRCGNFWAGYCLKEFVQIDGYTWFITWSAGDFEQENEDPGGSVFNHQGLRAIPIGPVSCTFSQTGINGTPKKILLEQDTSATNFAHCLDPAKHRFRYKLNSGAWSAWRCGQTELQNLDSVVNGKAVWAAYTSTDTVYVEHQMCSGWPYDWQDIQGTPTGSPATPNLGATNIGPPRDVLPMFVCDVVGGGSYQFNYIRPGNVRVESMTPRLLEVYEVP